MHSMSFKRDEPGVVTLDLGLPPSPGDTREGFLALAEMLQANPLTKVLVITGQSEKENGMEAIGQGAYDFLAKPVNVDELKVIIDRAIHVQQLDRERRELVEKTYLRLLRRPCRGKPADAEGLCDDREGCRRRCARSDFWREWYGEGACCARHPSAEPPQFRPVYRNQLRRNPGEPSGERTVRPRKGSFHGCSRAETGSRRDGPGRNTVSRRNRRIVRSPAGEAPALSAGTSKSNGSAADP